MTLSTRRALLYATLTVGILDAADAIIFFGLRSGVRPIRIFQSIAAGLLGRASFSGGLRTALLGVALHFFIAFAIVAVFFAASRRLSGLRQWPVASGLLYGIAVYLFMNLVVLPLSAAGRPTFVWSVVLNDILIHMLGVGLPTALFASRSR